MNVSEWLQIILFGMLLVGCTPLLGEYMARVYAGERNVLSPILRPVEKILYRLAGIRETDEQTWWEYAASLLIFHLIGFVLLFALLLLQGYFPLNPLGMKSLDWPLAFNIATSYVTNTNWQSYAGETTLSHLVQMLGLTVQNFASASVGIAVLMALIRGIKRHSVETLGNYWVDLLRGVLYIFLPLSLILALILVSQGVIQNLSAPVSTVGLNGISQLIPQGPAASQIAIKQLGTNGGGFFNTNSAHPYENPTPLSNFLETLAILLIPAALTNTYGRMVGSPRQGWAIFSAMSLLFCLFLGGMLASEYASNPILGGAAMLEGKEVRFGIANSVLWGTATTAASNGSVNAMLSSFSPLAGGLAMLNIMLGEVIFGGVGAGLYGMLLFIFLAAFIAGLMVGRTPEYLGKKIEAKEIQMTIIAILIPSACILIPSAAAVLMKSGLASRINFGPHGLSEILYAFTSAAGNNGSGFAGLNANTTFYNLTLGIGMWLGRLGVILPVLAIAGSLARKKYTPPSPGTLPTDKPLFVGMLIAVILIVGALTFFPALALGPVVEHLLMIAGKTY
jgi:potassium-transporting ATPase potassium-binding subunit